MGMATCGYCGEEFRAARPSCPHCGSDRDTGWKDGDEIDAASVEIATMDDEGYEAFLREEGLATDPANSSKSSIRLALALLGFLILCLAVLYILKVAAR